MGFQKVQLHDVGGQLQQALEIAQAPSPMMGGDTSGLFQFDRGMLFGELKQTEHHAQTLRSAALVHGLGPGARQRTDEPATIQQIIDAALDDVPFAAVQVRGIGGELARLGQCV